MRCPYCHKEFEPEDAEVEGGDYDAAILAEPVPDHLKCETVIEGVSPVTTLTYRRINPAVVLLIPFTCVWSGGSIYGIYIQQLIKHKFDLGATLFGIPFLIATVVLVCVVLFMLFGREVVTLSRGRGKDFTGVGPFGRTRHFEYGRDSRIEALGSRVGLVEVWNPGKPGKARICRSFDEEARDYTAALLRREANK